MESRDKMHIVRVATQPSNSELRTFSMNAPYNKSKHSSSIHGLLSSCVYVGHQLKKILKIFDDGVLLNFGFCKLLKQNFQNK